MRNRLEQRPHTRVERLLRRSSEIKRRWLDVSWAEEQERAFEERQRQREAVKARGAAKLAALKGKRAVDDGQFDKLTSQLMELEELRDSADQVRGGRPMIHPTDFPPPHH